MDRYCWGDLIVVVSLFLGGMGIGGGMGQWAYQHKAVKDGVAEFVCDPQTGAVYFQWKGKQ